MGRNQGRQQTYEYIRNQLIALQGRTPGTEPSSFILLEDLRLLEENITDPATELIASLEQAPRGVVSESESERYIVIPCKDYP